jgi:hypothetical protein
LGEGEGNGAERRVAYEGRFVRLEEQIKRLEEQIGRLVSDAESEKETRRRVNVKIVQDFGSLDDRIDVLGEKISKRIGKIEHKIYWFSGIISAFVFGVHWIFK